MDTYPLYPELNEAGNKEAQELIDKFKTKARKVLTDLLDEYLGECYINLLPEIQSDSWGNYRNAIMDGYRNYDNRLIQGRYDFKTIRQEIYKDFKDEIIKDLNQDNIEKIAELEKQIAWMRELEDSRNRY